MPRFNVEDYIEVKDRVVKFWVDHPNGSIITELLHVDDHVVRFKAAVYAERSDVPNAPLGFGHAEEYRISKEQIKENPKLRDMPNVSSAVENCETSAVGRALALAGYEVSKSVASRQEMEKVQRQQEVLQSALDKPNQVAKVPPNGSAPAPRSVEEAREIARRIKSTNIELSALKLKLISMGIENPTSLAETVRTLTNEQVHDLESWAKGEQEENAASS